MARGPREARRNAAGAAEAGGARALARREREGDVEPVRVQRRTGPLRPFDEHDPRLRGLLEAELAELLGVVHAIEIGVHDGTAGRVVGLDQREGRAWDLERLVAGERPDDRARERRLAGAELARQRDDVAGLQLAGEEAREAMRRGFVRQRHVPCGRRSGRARLAGGFGHVLVQILSGSGGGEALRRAVRREDAGHRRPGTGFRVKLDPAAMQLDEGAHDREPEADAAMAGAERVGLEALEDPRADLRGNAAAFVMHPQDDVASALAGRDPSRSARRPRSRPHWTGD